MKSYRYRKFLILSFLCLLAAPAAQGHETAAEYHESLSSEVRQTYPDFDPLQWRRDRELQKTRAYTEEEEQYLQKIESECRLEECENCKAGVKKLYIYKHTPEGAPLAKCAACIYNSDCSDGIMCNSVLNACKPCPDYKDCPESVAYGILTVSEAIRDYYRDKKAYPQNLADLFLQGPAYLEEANLNVEGYGFQYKNSGDNFELHFIPKKGWGFNYYTDNSFKIHYELDKPATKQSLFLEI